MKVLMLGWEFPPHISGGLGTACHGLTRGLSQQGVDVVFVVARARGDEDARHLAEIVGANQVEVGGAEAAPGANARLVEEEWDPELGPEGDERAWRVRRSLELVAIDSLLTPYLTPAGYEDRLREHADRVEALAGPGRRVRARIVPLDAPAAPVPASAQGPRRVLEFSGSYGRDLMAEVGRYAASVAEIARTREHDVVHAHDWMAVPAGLAAARASNKPLVLHVHACEYDRSGESVNPQVRELERLGMEGADRVVCVSHYTARVVRTRYGIDPAKIRVVHNGLDGDPRRGARAQAKAIPEPIVLFLGRVTFQKGPDYFLETAARVVKVEPRVKFVMSGSGDMLPAMIERAARLGLSRHVHFTGFLRGKEVERMYSMADIYVMPSVSEPFGISPLEAMAQDVPVVLSRQSGVSEVLKNALKVDFWDVQETANKILALLRYPALSRTLRDEGREEVRRMGWERPAELVRGVYEELAGVPS
ncbi:MAG: glycosyltransferase family 4 protein [Planctomycetia bacterium]